MGLEKLNNKIIPGKILVDGKEVYYLPISLIDLDLVFLSHGDTVRFITENLKEMNLEILIRKIET